MKEHAQIVIIGGGIVGVSTAYHLARRGMTDVTLLERTELTSGSTWHAAGNLPHFSGSLNVMKLQQYSKQLYTELERRHGDIGHHVTGALRLAHTAERVDEFHRIAGMAKLAGIDMTIVGPKELAQSHPHIVADGIRAALWDPLDGHIDPSSVTNAMAADARALGVEIRRNEPVRGISRAASGRWQIETEKARLSAKVIVNAAGFRASEIARMIGHPLPIALMEHQYIVTEAIPTLEATDRELCMVRDPDVSYYLRQERKGFIIGPYEHHGKLWATDGVPPAFGQELLAPDLERIEDILAAAMERVPIAANAGIKTVVNGPITYTPDGLPLIGPVHGIDGYYLNCGSSFGIVQGGGSGRFCAEWILDGHPSLDLWELDPRRFGDHATKSWVEAKCKDIYDNEYAAGFPFEFAMRKAGRPAKVVPILDRHLAAGAVLTTTFGWERPAWFAAKDAARDEAHTYRRSNAFASIAAECRAVRERLGLLDLSPFAKFDVVGANAEALIDALGANRAPRKIGSIALTHALTPQGGVLSEFSVTRLGPDHFYLASAAAAQHHDHDLIRTAARSMPGVDVHDVTRDFGTLVLAGPHARDVLSRITNADISNAGFPWLTGKTIEIAGVSVRALRVNFVGELGWELHHPIGDQPKLYDALMAAGQAHGIAPFGLRAMDSLRLEKMYRGWRNDLSPEFTLIESGMERFARLDKTIAFTGRAALEAERARGPKQRLVGLDIAADDCDSISVEPIFLGNRIVGVTSSGGYAHHLRKSLAIAYIETALAVDGTRVEIDLLGRRHDARVVTSPLYDPDNARLKS